MNSPSYSRRQFICASTLAGIATWGASSASAQKSILRAAPTSKDSSSSVRIPGVPEASHAPGAQRLSVAALERWEAMKFGMFIHFGMSTFVGADLPGGADPSSAYAPDRLDVDQWISIARDAGMKYAVLTTKHVAGHCLWPTRHNDYHVGTSGNTTDVVAAFLKACERRGVKPGFYYCAWDNHNRFGSHSPNLTWPAPPASGSIPTSYSPPFVTQRYLDFQWAQIDELMDDYGPITEWWLDIPTLLPYDYRSQLYAHIAERQPESVIACNHGIGDGSTLNAGRVWPTDILTIERFLPNSTNGHLRWRNVDGADYYVPGEVCDPIGAHWFHTEEDQPRSDAELLGMYLTSVSRNANLLLNVGPDRHGLIPQRFADALRRLRSNLDILRM